MSLDGTYDDGNIFAKILRGEAPAQARVDIVLNQTLHPHPPPEMQAEQQKRRN